MRWSTAGQWGLVGVGPQSCPNRNPGSDGVTLFVVQLLGDLGNGRFASNGVKGSKEKLPASGKRGKKTGAVALCLLAVRSNLVVSGMSD